jgi:hypothetical protein
MDLARSPEPLTDDQIERRVEHLTDALDRAYLKSAMPEAEYRQRLAKIDAWADAEAARSRAARYLTRT